MKRLAWLLPVLLICPCAFGDVIHLARGGKLTGKLVDVTIKIGDETRELPGKNILSVKLGDEGIDIVVTRDGKTIECVVDKVGLRTIGGQFVLERAKLSSIDLAMSDRERLRKEYDRRRGDLKTSDVAGHLVLARWCEMNDMHTEKRREYETCLVAAPNDPRCESWHKSAGHVSFKDKWMTSADARAADVADKQANGMIKYNGKWISQDKKTQLEACAEKIKDHLAQAKLHLGDECAGKLKDLERKYEAALRPLRSEMDKLEGEVDRLNRLIQEASREAARRNRAGTRARPNNYRSSSSTRSAQYIREKRIATDRYKRVKSKRDSLITATKRQKSRIESDRRSKLRRLADVKSAFSTILQGLNVIGDDKIRDAISKAIGVK